MLLGVGFVLAGLVVDLPNGLVRWLWCFLGFWTFWSYFLVVWFWALAIMVSGCGGYGVGDSVG